MKKNWHLKWTKRHNFKVSIRMHVFCCTLFSTSLLSDTNYYEHFVVFNKFFLWTFTRLIKQREITIVMRKFYLLFWSIVYNVSKFFKNKSIIITFKQTKIYNWCILWLWTITFLSIIKLFMISNQSYYKTYLPLGSYF